MGVSRVLTLPATTYFGLTGSISGTVATASGTGFGQSPFYSGTFATSNYALLDADFRTLIYAKALANISDCSIPSINAVLMTLFSASGNAWVVNGRDMTMKYHLDFVPTIIQTAIVSSSGVLPRPLGVAATLEHL